MYLTPFLTSTPFGYILISDEVQYNVYNLYIYCPKSFLNIPIPCNIFIKLTMQVSLYFFWGGGDYMIGRRLINSLLTRFMHTCAFFFCTQYCRTFPCFSRTVVHVLRRVGSVITQTLLTLYLFTSAIKCLT